MLSVPARSKQIISKMQVNNGISIVVGMKMPQDMVFSLLDFFDDSAVGHLSERIDLLSYSKKLSSNALFLIVKDLDNCLGFVAYYINTEGKFAYISQIITHKTGRHKGIGHLMIESLKKSLIGSYNSIRLEVYNSNTNALEFYKREGFVLREDRGEKSLLELIL